MRRLTAICAPCMQVVAGWAYITTFAPSHAQELPATVHLPVALSSNMCAVVNTNMHRKSGQARSLSLAVQFKV